MNANPSNLMYFAAAAALAALTGVATGQVSLTSIGILPGGYDSQAYAISRDGLVVVGYCTVNQDGFGHRHAVRWTSGGGLTDLGEIPGATFTMYEAHAISDDGTVVVGVAADFPLSGDRQHAFRWTLQGGMQDMNVNQAPDDQCSAVGVSGDGTVIVGNSYYGGAFRWDAETLTFPWLGSATAISRDGSIIIGAQTVGSQDSAVRWSTSGGAQDIGSFYPWSLNDDASVIVGFLNTYPSQAIRWTNATGATVLPVHFDYSAGAGAVSSDGSVIGGCLGSTGACIWIQGAEAIDLNQYLATQGIDMTGWTLSCVQAISADGLTLAGTGHYNNIDMGWVIQLAPRCGSADFNHDGDSGTDQDIEDFFSCLAGNCCPSCDSADFNGDGDTATDADIEAFFRVLAGGNC